MTATFGSCKSWMVSALAVGVLAFSATAQGPVFSLLGVPNGGGAGNIGRTSPDCAVSGDTITCPGGGRTVHFSIGMTGWGDGSSRCVGGVASGELCTDDSDCLGDGGAIDDGRCHARELDTFQVTVDGTSYDNGSFALNPLNYPAGDRTIGAYQVLKTCFQGMSDGVACGDAGNGPFGPGLAGVTEADCQADGGLFCVGNLDFVFACCAPIAAVSTASINYYSWGATTTAHIGRRDDGTVWYGGDLVLEIPAGASGTWDIEFLANTNLTFMSDFTASAIGDCSDPADCLQLLAGHVVVPTGKCCTWFGQGFVCENDLSMDECEGWPSSGWWTESDVCNGPVAPDQADPDDCCVVEQDDVCDDGNACTDDWFQQSPGCGCNNTPNYDVATECCDPADGSTVLIDDGVECTNCFCDRGTPVCVQAADNSSCDDGNVCTINDDCSAGVCGGDLVGEIACPNGDECPDVGQGCDLDTHLCLCTLETDLCVNPAPHDAYADPNCFDAGDTVTYTVQMGGGTVAVSGGQFLMSYDPACMTFQSIGVCEGSIFDTEIDADVDEVNGVIFYAVIVDPTAPTSTTEPADLACLTFEKNADCDECTVCLEDENPRHTILASADGNRVPIAACDCGKSIRANGELALNAPPGESVNVDCDRTTADVTWDVVSASDSCDGPLTIDCASEHVDGDPTADVFTGGTHVQGKHFYMCEATNSCGDSAKNVWTVDVSSNQALDVVVHLSPAMDAGVFSRCITFNLYNDDQCWSNPVEEEAVISFNGPYNFAGHGTGTLKIGKGQYTCITAQDCLHTLRASASINCADGRWSAVFKGANWLLGGNLDCWKPEASPGFKNCINIVDFTMFIVEIASGADYANGNTDCETEGPHGDINADGNVDTADYGFILENFLECSKDLCCDDGARDGDNLTTEISVKELRRLGMGDLAVADLNGDGWVNMDDMTAYMQGVRPVTQRVKRTNR